MAMFIQVSKPEILGASTLQGQLSAMCERLITKEGHLVLFPHPGKLMALLKIFRDNDIPYDVAWPRVQN